MLLRVCVGASVGHLGMGCTLAGLLVVLCGLICEGFIMEMGLLTRSHYANLGVFIASCLQGIYRTLPLRTSSPCKLKGRDCCGAK